MTSSSSDQNLIQESLEAFLKGLQFSVPLRHFSEHQDEAKVRQAAQQEFSKVFMNFTQNKTSEISMSRTGNVVQLLCSEVSRLTEEYVTRSLGFKKEAESFLQKRVEVCYEDFLTSFETKLLINPDMDLKTVEELFDNGKLKVTDSFEYLWKQGNIDGFEEHRKNLQQKLEHLKKEMIEKQSRHLQIKADEDARQFLTEVKAILLEMSSQFEGDIVALQPQGFKSILREKVQGILNYLVGKGKVVKEKYEKLYSELLGVLEDSIQFLDEAAEVISVEDASRWMKNLRLLLQSCFEHNGKEMDEQSIQVQVQQTRNELEMPSNEFVFPAEMHQYEGLAVSLKVEPEEPKLTIVAVTSLQPETLVNEDDGEMENDARSMEMDQEIELEIMKSTIVDGGNLNNHADDIELDSGVGETIEMTAAENDGILGMKRSHEVHLDTTSPSPPASKKPRQTDHEMDKTVRLNDSDDSVLNVPEYDGDFALLRAIREGESFRCIERMLDDGANVNVTGRSNHKDNAAHAVIKSLILKQQNPIVALDILKLLEAKGFDLINDGGSKGLTPLLYAMEYEELNEDILEWFSHNGADFNAVEVTGNSVLLRAIGFRQSAEIIKKIIEFGGNAKFVNKWKWNALHVSARYGHDSALKIFLDRLYVNEVDVDGNTPLHFLFRFGALNGIDECDYEPCFKRLLEKGADFSAKCNLGYVPLAKWMLGEGNSFPTLMKMKNKLRITQEIASAALTTLVMEMEKKKEYLPSFSGSPQNEFVQFILLLLRKKKATLIWKEECQWKLDEWKKHDKTIFSRNFFKELTKINGGVKYNDEVVDITTKNVGKLDFHTKFSTDSVKIENILVCMLASKSYLGFVEVCRFVKRFCAKL